MTEFNQWNVNESDAWPIKILSMLFHAIFFPSNWQNGNNSHRCHVLKMAESLLAKDPQNHKQEDCPAELFSSAAQYYFIKYNKALLC